MVRNLIFDIGNVLLDFKPLPYINAKIPEQDTALAIHNEIFLSEEWVMLDRGTITEDEAINKIVGRSRLNGDLIRLAFKDWYELLTPVEGTVQLLKELKKAGYKVYFLSNFHLAAFEYVNNRYDFFKLFDGGIVSYKEKLIKPEKSIYNRLTGAYGLKPSESVFIDDSRVNVECAEKLGFNAILFADPRELRERLKELEISL